MDENFEKELDELSEAAKNISVKPVKNTKYSRADFKIDVPEDAPNTLRYNIVRYLNSQKYKVSDFYDFCIKRSENKSKGYTLAMNIISSLKEHRNMRIDTLELLCEFLKLDIVIQPISEEQKDGDNNERQ